MYKNKKFDVEHALSMYASSYVILPAWGIYEKEIIAELKPRIDTCHIYIIGTLPAVELVDDRVDGQHLVLGLEVAGARHELSWPIPEGARIVETDQGRFVEKDGILWAPSEEFIMRRLNNEQDAIAFDVLYVGQAYGKDGSRNALDRLLKHETLQKISVKGIPVDRRLTILMLELESGNRMITVMNPWAQNKGDGPGRIAAGLDKLFGTSDAERVTLYEASFIRYFQPPFNKEFKSSFPSTNLKVLSDCYEKDFACLVSEICIDELPFKLASRVVSPAQYHTAKFDLHDDEARQMFFSQNS
jgi:hypothetical protein